MTLAAAADIDRDRVEAFCRTHEVPGAYTAAGEMLAREQPDLVFICTPPHLHAELSVEAAEAGAWVLCEKPLAASLAELDTIAAAEKRTGNPISSVYQWRFGSGSRHLKALLSAGELGSPLLGICQTTWYRDDAYYAVPWRGTWASELGGCTMGHGIHATDLFLWLFGPWSHLWADIDHLNHNIEIEDASLAQVRFDNGALGSVITSVVSPRQESYLRLDFARATLELRHLYAFENKHWTYTPVEGEAPSPWSRLPEDVPSLYAAQLGHILDCMTKGEPPMTSGPGARMTLEFITCLYKSAFTGQRIERGSVVPGDPFYDSMNGGRTL